MASFPVPVEYKIVRNVQSVRKYVKELDQSNTPIVVRRRHRVRYYVIRDVFDIYKYCDAIDLRYYVIREAIVI